jgi:hypothetical protein
MAVNGVGGPNPNAARVYGPRPAARPEPAAAPATVAAPAPPGPTGAQARRAVASENAAAANPRLDDATAAGLQGLVRRAAEANARPGARVDLRL